MIQQASRKSCMRLPENYYCPSKVIAMYLNLSKKDRKEFHNQFKEKTVQILALHGTFRPSYI
jgi:hypothetical protein